MSEESDAAHTANETDHSLLEEAAKNHLILELKKKALACKQAGETAEALEHLKDSKRVAAANSLEDVPPSLQCSYLRSLAAHLKATNDIPGALAALKQAKQIEQEAAQAEEDDAGREQQNVERLSRGQDERYLLQPLHAG